MDLLGVAFALTFAGGARKVRLRFPGERLASSGRPRHGSRTGLGILLLLALP